MNSSAIPRRFSLGLFSPERRFGALLAPHGLHIVAYRRRRGGVLEILRHAREPGPTGEVAAAADALANLLEADGARGGRVGLAVSGWGACSHRLTLPPAAKELLRPIVARELSRFYPDVQDPVVDFVLSAVEDERVKPKRELLAAALPSEAVHVLRGALAVRGIELAGVSILARALQRLFDAFVGAAEPTVLVLALPGAPILGFFHEGELRLFREPPVTEEPEEATLAGVPEQVERGMLFLRQQFRGARVARLLVAAEPADQPRIEQMLRDALALPVERLGPPQTPPGALAALGAGLEAEAAGGINLLPAELRMPERSEQLARKLLVASVVLLTAAALFWTLNGIRAERGAQRRLDAVRARLEAGMPPVTGAWPTVVARQQHEQRRTFLVGLESEQARLQDLLSAIARATPPATRLDSLHLERAEGDWRVTLAGVAAGESSAEAVRAIDRLYKELPRRLVVRELELTHFADLDPAHVPQAGNVGVAIGFGLSFIVVSGAEAGR